MTLFYEFKTNMKRKNTLYRVFFQLKVISQEKGIFIPSTGLSIQRFSARKAKMEKKVPGTLCLRSFFCHLEIRFTPTKSHSQSVQHAANHCSCTDSIQCECAKIKTRKLLGDYSSENSECNRRELRTLEIHFLESV